MIQTNVIKIQSLRLNVISRTGHLIQVRNHVKVHPWRKIRSSRESYLDPTRTPYTDPYNINEFLKDKRQKKAWQIVIPKNKDNRFNSFLWNKSYRSDPAEARHIAQTELEKFKQSVEQRGHARECKPYNPPEGVTETIIVILKQSLIDTGCEAFIEGNSDTDDLMIINLNNNLALKFSFISKCIEELGHDLPNSYINDMETVKDVVDYYNTAVRGLNSYAVMVRQQDSSLPGNLHLISDPIRFDKESDQFFNGYNAMPGIVSKIPGLRASKKHPILNQDEFQWPDI